MIKVFIVINVVLAGLLGAGLWRLQKDLAQPPAAKSMAFDHLDAAALSRPGFGKADLAGFFDIQPSAPVSKPSAAASADAADGLNELAIGADTLRVQGIFLTDDIRLDVVALTGKKKRQEEILQLRPGQRLKQFEVVRIEQDALHLVGPEGAAVVLRVFQKEDGNVKNP